MTETTDTRQIETFASEWHATQFQKTKAAEGFETARYRRVGVGGWRYDVEYWKVAQ
jgi:hypothetical protein